MIELKRALISDGTGVVRYVTKCVCWVYFCHSGRVWETSIFLFFLGCCVKSGPSSKDEVVCLQGSGDKLREVEVEQDFWAFSQTSDNKIMVEIQIFTKKQF